MSHYCTFRLDGHLFGIPLEQVQEVLRAQPTTPVPLAPPTIAGLINLRGQIVTAIDLRLRLGLAKRPSEQPPMNIIVRTETNPVSLLVDEIGDVLQLSEMACERPPETLQPSMQHYITGIYQLPERLMLVLDSSHATDESVA